MAPSSDDTLIIAIACFCIIGVLVISSVVFCAWWCYINRKERHSLFLKARRKEHLKYLEEYSVRTEDADPDEVPSPQISPRSLHSTEDSSLPGKNGHNDSGFGVEDWAPHKVDHSTSLEASNASSALSNMHHTENNNGLSSGYYGYDNIDSELGTNIDDVKL